MYNHQQNDCLDNMVALWSRPTISVGGSLGLDRGISAPPVRPRAPGPKKPGSDGWRSWKFQMAFAIYPAVLLQPALLHAQTTAARTIRGRVSDPTGSIVDGVNVSAHSPHVGGTFTAVTDKEGDYLIVDLPPAEDYAVVAEKPDSPSWNKWVWWCAQARTLPPT